MRRQLNLSLLSLAGSDPATGVVSWGYLVGRPLEQTSALPVPVPGSAPLTDIAVGDKSVCSVRSTGTVACIGEDFSGSLGIGSDVAFAVDPVPVEDDGQFLSVASNFGTVCALRDDGSLRCWVSVSSVRLSQQKCGEPLTCAALCCTGDRAFMQRECQRFLHP